MKKVFLICAAALISITILAGCDTTADSGSASEVSGVESPDTTVDSTSEVVSVDKSGYSNDFDGFIQFMTDSGYISGEGTELSASAIGAVQGLRFTMSSGTSKYYVELYEFDTDNLNDTANTTIANARTYGTFELYGALAATQSTLAAVTNDDRFLMLYTDSSSNESNIEQKTNAALAVQSFGE